MHTLKMVQGDMQRYFNRAPPLFYLHPPFAGHAFWAYYHAQLIRREYYPLQLCYYLPDSPDKDEAVLLFDRLERSLREISHQRYLTWRANVPVKPT